MQEFGSCGFRALGFGDWGLLVAVGYKTPCLTRFKVSYLPTVSPIKLEAGERPNSAGIPCIVLLRMEAKANPETSNP